METAFQIFMNAALIGDFVILGALFLITVWDFIKDIRDIFA